MKHAYKMGHDAEFFIADAKGAIVPVCGKVGGTKENPKPIRSSKYGTTIQEDGVAVEFGMTPVEPQLFNKIASASLQEGMATVNKLGFSLDLNKSSYEFSKDSLEPYPQAFIMGCLPDRDAHQRGAARAAFPIEEFGNFRFTGGHIHLSYDCEGQGFDHKAANGTPTWAIVQMLDAMVLPTWMYYSTETQGKRFDFYGRPGLYRNKPYGVEYRTPSNHIVVGNKYNNTGTITRMATVVQAAAELPTTTFRGFYDRIDWQQVLNLLNLNLYPTYGHRVEGPLYGVVDNLENVYREMSTTLGELRS